MPGGHVCSGPLLPFVSTIDCCGAARQTGYSLRVLNLWMVELTHCGRSGPSQVQVTLMEQSLTHSSSLLMQREKCDKIDYRQNQIGGNPANFLAMSQQANGSHVKNNNVKDC